MSRGNPGPYVDASTALFTNEAVWAGGRGGMENNEHMWRD